MKTSSVTEVLTLQNARLLRLTSSTLLLVRLTEQSLKNGDPNTVEGIYYVIGYSDNRINEELIMEDLNDLYDFILMDDVDTTAEVTDLWADSKGGSTMTI